MINLPIHHGFYESDSLPISAQECTNWYVNIPQVEGAFTQGSLVGTPGTDLAITTGDLSERNRGSHVMDNVSYFVNGETLYKVTPSIVVGVEVFSALALGVIPGADRVSMANNGNQLIIVASGKGYIYDGAFEEIQDADVYAQGALVDVVFIDSFFVFATANKKLIKSKANDGHSYNALEFLGAENNPDGTDALIVFKNQIFVGGSETIEVFDNVGAPTFPFQRIKGFVINKGISAKHSLIKTSDSFMFLGAGLDESPAIWALSGNSVQKASTTAIDSVLNRMSDEEIASSFAWSYAEAGAYFIGFTFNSRTFVFDTISSKWHERKSQINGVLGRWRVNSIVSAYGYTLVGDVDDGRIGKLSLDTYTEYDSNIIRTNSSMPFTTQAMAFGVPKIKATMESGVGTATLDPQVIMSTSKDGGKTWSNGISRGFGLLGEYNRQTIWRRLGRFTRSAIFRFEMSEAVKPSFIKLEAVIKSGN